MTRSFLYRKSNVDRILKEVSLASAVFHVMNLAYSSIMPFERLGLTGPYVIVLLRTIGIDSDFGKRT